MFPECKYFMSLYKQCFCHGERRGYSGAECERFVRTCVCVCMCGLVVEALVAVPVCDRRPPGKGVAPGKVTQQSGFCMVM